METALLTMKYQRLGNDGVAAGFLTFLAGESLLLARVVAPQPNSIRCKGLALAAGGRDGRPAKRRPMIESRSGRLCRELPAATNDATQDQSAPNPELVDRAAPER